MSDNTNTAAARPAVGAAPARADEGPWAQVWPTIQKVLVFWLISQVASTFLGSKKAPAPPPPEHAIPGSSGPVVSPNIRPAWPLGSVFDMYVVLSTSLRDPFGVETPQMYDLPWVKWENIKLGDWKEDRVENMEVNLPLSVQRNASLYAHIFLAKDQVNPNPYHPSYKPGNVAHWIKPLSRHMKKPKVFVEKNLLGGKEEDAAPPPPPEGDVWLSYWHQNLTINVISDPPVIAKAKGWPPIMQRYIQFNPTEEDTYFPPIFPNDFWLLREHMQPINQTTPTLPLRINFYPISTLKFQLYTSMGHGFEEASNKGQGGEMDEFKRVLIETNPWLLFVTAAVTLLHMLFETLAFSSDIAHWRTKKEFTGVSIRSILVNVVVQIITGLYLFDNSQETSWMILAQQVVAVLIEAWKITKAVDVIVTPAPAGSTLPWKVEFKDKHVLSETEKKTQEYDALAFKYVSYVAIPTLAAYTVYSLLYETHKGWYSFVITTLSSFVYMFGFVQLVPQLIINYKLKSVAHLPWKTMAYKTLSTVVDDFFAFVIKMPILHRLASFRDDVVFLILLYQRWIYRIDYTRANEYGQVGAVEEEVKVVEGTDKKE